jgi:hypothetical protein
LGARTECAVSCFIALLLRVGDYEERTVRLFGPERARIVPQAHERVKNAENASRIEMTRPTANMSRSGFAEPCVARVWPTWMCYKRPILWLGGRSSRRRRQPRRVTPRRRGY